VRTLAIINQKGGCGKTTTAINLSAVLASRGLRTLLVDLDPQSHCAAGLAIPEERIERDVSDLMALPEHKALDANRLLWRVGTNLDLLPSRTKLAAMEAARGQLAQLPNCERRLAMALERLTKEAGRHYDCCVIDCSPAIGLLTYNALTAAQEVIIPVETSYFSLQGASKQAATLRSLSRRLGTRQTARLLATIHDPTSTLARDLLSELRERFGHAVIPGTIRLDPLLKEAASYGQPILEYAPESVGAEDYSRLGDYLIERAGIEAEEPAIDEADLPTIEVLQRAVPSSRRAGRVEASRPAGAEPVSGPGHVVTPGRDADMPATERRSTGAPSWTGSPSNSGGSGTVAVAGVQTQVTTEAASQSASQAAIDAAAAIVVEPLSRMEDLYQRAQVLQKKVREATEAAGVQTLPETQIKRRVGALALVEDTAAPVTPPKSVERLFGVRLSGRRALFVQPATLGRRVSIAGSFNGWDAETHVMRRNDDLGVHELSVELTAGEHAYRLVVDGKWVNDPFNASTRPNEFGELNSLIRVDEPGRGV
jgi:cellulose biosynthesis protein BcsQ